MLIVVVLIIIVSIIIKIITFIVIKFIIIKLIKLLDTYLSIHQYLYFLFVLKYFYKFFQRITVIKFFRIPA